MIIMMMTQAEGAVSTGVEAGVALTEKAGEGVTT